MLRQRGGRPTRFTATERFAVERIGFVWEARFRVAPLVAIDVADGYRDGRGFLQVRPLGIPTRARAGPGIALGEIYRYLAELPWVPHAMTANPRLQWTGAGDRQVNVTTAALDRRPPVTLEFDAHGDIVSCSTPARPRQVGRVYANTAWGGGFSRYATLDGMRIPTHAEVYWDLPGGRFVYWRARVLSAQMLAESL